ncbi:hypothetical protein PUN28_008187 [Cardiocondyla obscurior]|uniref:Uncharacterized protein n=1 Tax=Cardiocondyla obscurior TaxID=286306 RepID=A0AAW2FYS7_9HYME
MPKENSNWEELCIKRIFGTASNYAEAMEKLIKAQDTSNIDDTADMSPNEVVKREKKRRRIKAKKSYSTTSSSDEDVTVDDQGKENNNLPAFPKINNYQEMATDQQSIIINKKHKNNLVDILTEKISSNTDSNSDKDIYNRLGNLKKATHI